MTFICFVFILLYLQAISKKSPMFSPPVTMYRQILERLEDLSTQTLALLSSPHQIAPEEESPSNLVLAPSTFFLK